MTLVSSDFWHLTYKINILDMVNTVSFFQIFVISPITEILIIYYLLYVSVTNMRDKRVPYFAKSGLTKNYFEKDTDIISATKMSG